MERQKKHIIKSIIKGSIADQLDIEPGDELIRINGEKIKDALDYHYYVNDEDITVSIKKSGGEEWELEIEKEYDEDLGIEFTDSLMDDYQSCRNKCIFCFIDQMPPNMRETLYFKDDDARLSFLQGNYITLTNMTEEDIDRICFYKLSPINISVHSADFELRNRMLNNRFAGESLRFIKKFYDARIYMNAQIVLCKGYNDNEELEHTINFLSQYIPYMQSVSVVPAGLTKYRDGLAELEPFTKEEAAKVIHLIEKNQKKLYDKYGTRMIHASDEWYIKAVADFPPADSYEGYMQFENGVGMVRSALDEFDEYFEQLKGDNRIRKLSAATGVLFSPVLKQMADKLKLKFPNVHVEVYTIYNHFFGTEITTAGLLTGQDIINQLKGRELYGGLLLPRAVLRAEGDLLLDDVSISDIEKALQTRIRIVQSESNSFLKTVLA